MKLQRSEGHRALSLDIKSESAHNTQRKMAFPVHLGVMSDLLLEQEGKRAWAEFHSASKAANKKGREWSTHELGATGGKMTTEEANADRARVYAQTVQSLITLRAKHGGKAGLEAYLARKAGEKAAAEKARMDAAAAARKAAEDKEAADRAYWAAVRGPAPVAVDSAW